jgi:hypothetical protein
MRDVFRRRSYAVPFGGIYNWKDALHPGLPMPNLNNKNTFVCLVDSILLGSAGLVALCDPLVTYDGEFYPTIFSSSTGLPEDDPIADNNEATVHEIKSNALRIGMSFPQFSDIYCRSLGDLFHTKSSNKQAMLFLNRSCDDLVEAIQRVDTVAAISAICRHLKPRIVSPYYFVEPTSLFHTDFVATNDAVIHGFGYVVGIKGEVKKRAFEEFEAKKFDCNNYILSAKLRSSRTSALLIHLQNHVRDGLAFIKPIQFMVTKMTSTGLDTRSSTARGNYDIDKYLWGRGQSCIMAPSELMYTGKSITCLVMQSSFDSRDLTYRRNHIPSLDDIGDMEITMSCTNPVAIDDGDLSAWIRRRNNARNVCTRALDSAREFVGSSMPTGGELLYIGENDVSISSKVKTGLPDQGDEKDRDYGGPLEDGDNSKLTPSKLSGQSRSVKILEHTDKPHAAKLTKQNSGLPAKQKAARQSEVGERDDKDEGNETPLDMADEENNSLTPEDDATANPPAAQ